MNHLKLNYLNWLFWTVAVGLPVIYGWLAVLAWQARRDAQRGLSAVSKLGERLSATERQLALAARQASEQAARVAWLETRVRPAKAVNGLQAAHEPPRSLSMTERRHRVLTLARRGMDAALIADTLGVPRGEVELILSLSAVAAA